ncbi:MAG: hypothetical protein IKI88_00230 [Anaerotignum sp.]|nr:hypothetical protein [Anaerotignum sp.]
MRIRVTVKKTSIFPADCVTVFSELQKIETLQYVAAPFASFIPVDGAKEVTWEPGSSLQNELDGQIFKSPLEKTILVHTMTLQYG